MVPSEEEWLLQKDTIRRIYFESTLAQLMTRMSDEYNFVASKGQYERKLKQWDFRKYLTTREEWDYVLAKTQKRKDMGKESKVTLFGFEITEQTIKKRRARYSLGELRNMKNPMRDVSPPIPEGISVHTPGDFDGISSAIQSSGILVSIIPQICSQSYAPNSVEQLSPVIQVTKKPTTRRHPNFIIKKISIERLPYFVYLDFIKSQDLDSLAEFLGSTTRESQYMVSTEHDQFHVKDSIWELDALIPQTISVVEPLPDKILEILIFGITKLEISQPSLAITRADLNHMLLTSLAPLMLEKETGDLKLQIGRLIGPSDMASFTEFLSLIIYVTSNTLLFEGLQCQRTILNWTVQQSRAVLQRMISLPIPSVKAFFEAMMQTAERLDDNRASKLLLDIDLLQHLYLENPEKLLFSAVRFGHTELVTELISEIVGKGQNINHPPYRRDEVYKFRHEIRTFPITLLGTTRTVGVAKALLDAGADVNALHADSRHEEVLSPVQRAIRNGNLNLVKLLLQYKADLNGSCFYSDTLFNAVLSGNSELVSLVLDAGAHCQHESQDMITIKCSPLPMKVESIEKLWERESELQIAASMGSVDIVARLLEICLCRREILHGKYRWAPLRNAAQEGHLEIVKQLISAGADVNATVDVKSASFWEMDLCFDPGDDRVRRFPTTALIAAVEGGHLDVAEYLLNNNADVNALAFGKYGSSVLEAAQNLGQFEMARSLVRHGAINFPQRLKGEQIIELKLAARRKDSARAKALVDKGADLEQLYKEFYDAYWLQSSKNISSILLELYTGKKEILGHVGAYLLANAITYFDFANARGLVLAGAPVDDHAAILDGHAAIFDRIANVVDKDFSETQQNEMIELLKEMGTVTNSKIYLGRALQFATAAGNFIAMQHLVSLGADVNARVWENVGTALQLAVRLHKRTRRSGANDIRPIKYLLDLGANVNAPPNRGCMHKNALQTAAGYSYELTKLLLNHGAEINAPAYKFRGTTALQAAASRGHLDIINLLLKNGADINAAPAKSLGFTSLQGAAIQGYLRVAHILLERGADPNAMGPEEDGRTALEGAAERGRLDIVHLLLNAGAICTESAVKFAETQNYYVVANILKERIRLDLDLRRQSHQHL